jgi:two-component system, response regulator / RNA-binding antiterminator
VARDLHAVRPTHGRRYPRVKILLADDDADRARDLRLALARDQTVEVVCTEPGEMLHDAVAAHSPDVVVVDMTRPDRDALEGVRRLSNTRPHPVVMFVDQDDPDFMQAAIDAGVSSYNVGSLVPAEMKPVLRAAVALFQRYQQTHRALTKAETRLRERNVVDRAKAILIRTRKFSEPEAYRWLQREAMASGRRIPDIALTLVQAQEREHE